MIRTLAKQLTLCYLLLALTAFALADRKREAAGICLLMVFAGGTGAAWSRWTGDGRDGDWLRFGGVTCWPDRLALGCAAMHAPALVAGLWLLRKGASR